MDCTQRPKTLMASRRMGRGLTSNFVRSIIALSKQYSGVQNNSATETFTWAGAPLLPMPQ
jgi:hypothetical protein